MLLYVVCMGVCGVPAGMYIYPVVSAAIFAYVLSFKVRKTGWCELRLRQKFLSQGVKVYISNYVLRICIGDGVCGYKGDIGVVCERERWVGVCVHVAACGCVRGVCV